MENSQRRAPRNGSVPSKNKSGLIREKNKIAQKNSVQQKKKIWATVKAGKLSKKDAGEKLAVLKKEMFGRKRRSRQKGS